MHYANEDIISFVGSINETGSGWTKNFENFKVFCNWKDETNKQAIDDDQKSFDNLWNNNEPHVKIFDIPIAVKNHLLEISPKSDEEYKETLNKIRQLIKYKKEQTDEHVKKLRPYQLDAKNNWIENNHVGIFSMATGTGKTITALGCINNFQKTKKRTITVIACPQTHLVDQWKKELTEYNLDISDEDKIDAECEIVCYGENPTWRNEFEYIMNDFNMKLFDGNYLISHVIVYATHKTINDEDFKKFILKIQNAEKILIVDEVHNIGSKLSRFALLDQYEGRLGLSATPIRHYDSEGTNLLYEYFNKVVYDLPLKTAIDAGYLCGYEYHPYYAELTPDEMEMYDMLTKKIAAKYSMKKRDEKQEQEYSYNAEIQRADLVANAQNKLLVLEKIINSIFNIKQTLIYCTSNPSPIASLSNTTQLNDVKKILNDNQRVSTSITFENPTKDRRMILEFFNCLKDIMIVLLQLNVLMKV